MLSPSSYVSAMEGLKMAGRARAGGDREGNRRSEEEMIENSNCATSSVPCTCPIQKLTSMGVSWQGA